MQYVCRSCILRLGQPWRTPAPAQPRRWPQPWARIPWRMNHSWAVPGDRGSPSEDASSGRDQHDAERLEAERFWATDGDWYPANLDEPSDTQNIDQILRLAISSSLEFRNIPTRTPKSRTSSRPSRYRPSRPRPAPESRPPSHRSSHSMEEDAGAVAFDEALDGAQEVEHNEPDNRDEHPKAQELGVNSKLRLPPLRLGQRDRNQLEVLRSTTRAQKSNFAKASADFTSWKRLLTEISNPGSKSPSFVELRMHHDILALDSADSMTSFLDYSSPDHKQKARNRILLYTTLRHAPEKGAMVLKALLPLSRLPFYMIEDSLGYLAYHLRQMEPAVKEACAQMLADLVIETAVYGGEGYVRLTQNTIYCILAAIRPTQLEDWFHQLVARGVPMHKYTLLQFASRFAKMSATKDLSLDIWRDLCGSSSLDINTPLGASLCTSLLTFKEDDLHALDENLATPAELFQSLLDLGLVPNVITYTTIIHSLCVRKDVQTAMEVFEVMKQHGVQPDHYTHSVMMNGFKSCGDFASLLRFASDARAAGIQDAVVWNELIHATFQACLKEPRVPGGRRRARCVVWGPMNAIFARFFRPEPLRTFITAQFGDVREFMEKQGFVPSRMKGAFHDLQQLHPAQLIQPTSSTLGLMILGFIRHLPRPNDVVLFYDHFKKLLREGNPVAQSIVQEQGSIVHDVVLRSLLKWKGTLRIMLSIIRDMMTDVQPAAAVTRPSSLQTFAPQMSDSDPNSATNIEDPHVDPTRPATDTTTAADGPAEAEGGAADRYRQPLGLPPSNTGEHHEEPRPPIRHPRPSVYTWSILLKAFMSNRLSGEAEHILKLMKIHGVKPNIVTWNTLATEYARQGNTKQAVEAMRRLEAAGYKSDDWTLRAFSRISDKAKAIRLMEETVEKNKAAMEGDSSGQHRGEEEEVDQFDEIMGQESLAEKGDLSLYYEEALGIAPEVSHEEWPAQDSTPSAGRETKPEAQSPARAAEEPQPVSGRAPQAPSQEEPQKPAAKAPAPKKQDLGAWDAFLWDHAAESGPEEEQDKREESAA